jgi:predicted nucleotidyltransferase
LRSLIRENLPPRTPVYLFGSRARGDARWNSDFDLWIDADIDPSVLVTIDELLEESFVPFHVDLVTTRQLNNTLNTPLNWAGRP